MALSVARVRPESAIVHPELRNPLLLSKMYLKAKAMKRERREQLKRIESSLRAEDTWIPQT